MCFTHERRCFTKRRAASGVRFKSLTRTRGTWAVYITFIIIINMRLMKRPRLLGAPTENQPAIRYTCHVLHVYREADDVTGRDTSSATNTSSLLLVHDGQVVAKTPPSSSQRGVCVCVLYDLLVRSDHCGSIITIQSQQVSNVTSRASKSRRPMSNVCLCLVFFLPAAIITGPSCFFGKGGSQKVLII